MSAMPKANASKRSRSLQVIIPQKTARRFYGHGLPGVDVEKILTPEERADKATIVASLERRLLQSPLKGEQEQALREFLGSKTKLNNADILTAIRLMMSTPAYQVT